VLWLARLHPEVLGFAQRKPSTDSADAMDLKDRVAFEKLSQVMQSEQLYKNHGLSIGELASEVGLAEHHLRKLINQTLGYRNFSSYLNSYRIDAVKALLADQEKLRTPILTLALDSGFSSLAPFNRAFKASENITPTQFREQAQSKP
jgi:AraC-like DNA-binding protein